MSDEAHHEQTQAEQQHQLESGKDFTEEYADFAEHPEFSKREEDTEFSGEVSTSREVLEHPQEKRLRTNETRGAADFQAFGQRATGIIALVLAVASLFLWPAVLGPAAAVIGFLAWYRGNRALGMWSIAIGLISFIAYVFFIPYYFS